MTTDQPRPRTDARHGSPASGPGGGRRRRWAASGALAGLAAVVGAAALPGSADARVVGGVGTVAAIPAAPTSPGSFTLVATGDFLMHQRLWRQAAADAPAGRRFDFGPQIASVAGITRRASVAVCHLETPLAPEAGPYAGYPAFSSPPQIVDTIKAAGYDVCTTASNHTFDRGTAGIGRSLARLDAAGIVHHGSARTAAEASRIPIVQVRTSTGARVPVAFLSFTYGFNGIPYPHGQRWRGNVIDVARITADAARARRQGAAVVVLSLHAGTEYVHTPNAQQRAVVAAVTRHRTVDLVIGHHAHVVQPITKVNGVWVAYGHGNLVSAHGEPTADKSEEILTRFTFTRSSGRWTATRAEYLPLLQTYAMPVRALDVQAALASGHYGTATRSRLVRARDNVRAVVSSAGGARAEMMRAGG